MPLGKPLFNVKFIHSTFTQQQTALHLGWYYEYKPKGFFYLGFLDTFSIKFQIFNKSVCILTLIKFIFSF